MLKNKMKHTGKITELNQPENESTLKGKFIAIYRELFDEDKCSSRYVHPMAGPDPLDIFDVYRRRMGENR